MKSKSKTIEFQQFIITNRIKKREIAEYLNVSTPFITQLANGSRGIPNDKIALLKQNKDWDTSMFDTPTLNTPMSDTPMFNTPMFNTPMFNTPTLNTPTLNTPTFTPPIVDTSSPIQDSDGDKKSTEHKPVRIMNHATPPPSIPFSVLMERLDKKDAQIDSLIKTIASQQHTIEILATKIK